MQFGPRPSVPIPGSGVPDMERRENAGGAPEHDSIHNDYGRRIESNRSWTIYHVFSGIPAIVGGAVLTGLDALGSMERMMALNTANRTSRLKNPLAKSPSHLSAQGGE